MRTIQLGVFVALLCLCLGCGPRAVHIDGKVTYRGKPVEEGTIELIPIEGTAGPSTGGPIKAGRYEIATNTQLVPGGNYQVRISALAKTGKMTPNILQPGGPPLDLSENYIPACYNSHSTLKVRISADARRILRFSARGQIAMHMTRRAIGLLLAIGAFSIPARLARPNPLSTWEARPSFSSIGYWSARRIASAFTQHQGTKHPQNPLLKADQPWEGWRVEIFGNVIYDEQEKLFKMWYLAEPEGEGGYFDDPNVTCYATSIDGIHWQKPLVGTLPAKNGKPHNAVAHIHQASVIKDLQGSRSGVPLQVHRLVVGAEGLQHVRLARRIELEAVQPASRLPRACDVMTGFWDAATQALRGVSQDSTVSFGAVTTRRLFFTITSRDFVHWSEPVLSWTTDLRDDAGSLARIEQVRPILDRPDDPRLMRTEYYGIGVYPAESCTIGFPWILTINNNARWGNQRRARGNPIGRFPRSGELGAAVPHAGDRHRRARSLGRLVSHVRRRRRSALATRSGSTTAGRTTRTARPASTARQFEDGRPTGRRTKYTGSIGLVTWKLDRFVSADGPAEGGVLTTVPVKFSGKRLEINAATRSGGSVVVEICDAAGKPLAGYAPSDPFRGDDLRHVVTFRGRSDVSALAGKPIVLRLHLRSAELYSFAFRQ